MVMITLGAAILVLGAMTEYVGYNEASKLVGNFPGFEFFRQNPMVVWIAGGALVVLSLVFPSGSKKPKGDWESKPF